MKPSSWPTCDWRWLLILALWAAPTPPSGWAAEPTGESAWERHLQELADRLPSGDFHIVSVPPFVVIGDGPLEQLERRARGTVQWAVSRLQSDFFPRGPKQTIDIWLLKDADSYRKHSRQLFGINPSTPFGYFSQSHRALVMDISTGGGTLVHEMVHPLMAANFPQCPAWFDEGLASLYEQCGDCDGHIWGHTNWRLRGLQRAIRAGRVPSFKTLCHTSPREFYGEAEDAAVVLRPGPLSVLLPAGAREVA